MDLLNYASLEASKRLAEKGIVLETDAFWRNLPVDAHCRDSVYEWNLGFDRINGCYEKSIPAPSMAEVWRELPGSIWIDNRSCHLEVEKYSAGLVCHYINEGLGITSGRISNNNPTDALIDLLIWVKKNQHD